MSHKPECLARLIPKLSQRWSNGYCPLCNSSERAYKRGREDASAAIERVRALHKPEANLEWQHDKECREGDNQWTQMKTLSCKPQCEYVTILECHGCDYHPDYGRVRYPCPTIDALDGQQIASETNAIIDPLVGIPNVGGYFTVAFLGIAIGYVIAVIIR